MRAAAMGTPLGQPSPRGLSLVSVALLLLAYPAVAPVSPEGAGSKNATQDHDDGEHADVCPEAVQMLHAEEEAIRSQGSPDAREVVLNSLAQRWGQNTQRQPSAPFLENFTQSWPPISPRTARSFLEALHAEYVEGVGEAVGELLDHANVCPEAAQTLDAEATLNADDEADGDDEADVLDDSESLVEADAENAHDEADAEIADDEADAYDEVDGLDDSESLDEADAENVSTVELFLSSPRRRMSSPFSSPRRRMSSPFSSPRRRMSFPFSSPRRRAPAPVIYSPRRRSLVDFSPRRRVIYSPRRRVIDYSPRRRYYSSGYGPDYSPRRRYYYAGGYGPDYGPGYYGRGYGGGSGILFFFIVLLVFGCLCCFFCWEALATCFRICCGGFGGGGGPVVRHEPSYSYNPQPDPAYSYHPSPRPPISPRTEGEFIAALRTEYVEGRIGAVGDFYASANVSQLVTRVLDAEEGAIRDLPQHERWNALNRLAESWGQQYVPPEPSYAPSAPSAPFPDSYAPPEPSYAPPGSISPRTRSAFLDAMQREYFQGEEGAVGDFFDRADVSQEAGEMLAAEEDAIRGLPTHARQVALQDLARRFGQ